MSSEKPRHRRIDDGLLACFYAEFRDVARRALNRNGVKITIQPTDLVHEAAVRLLGGSGLVLEDDAHFFAIGVRAIRATLIDEVRRRAAAKRDGALVTQWDEADGDAAAPIGIEEFDAALEDLTKIEPAAAEVVQLRFYVGLTMEEIARELGISESTALRRWRVARAWLLKELHGAA